MARSISTAETLGNSVSTVTVKLDDAAEVFPAASIEKAVYTADTASLMLITSVVLFISLESYTSSFNDTLFALR